MKLGQVFTVKKMEAGAWSTTLYLKEFPGERFNNVNFALATAADLQPK